MEAVNVQFGVANLDGTDHADHTGVGQRGGQHTHYVASFVGGGGVGRDVGQPEGVGRGSPREGDVGEVGGYFLQGSPVLGPVGDHQVVAFLGVPTDRRGGVLDDEGPVGDGHLGARTLRHDHVHRVHDALRERQIIGRAWGNHRDPQRLHRLHRLFGGFIGHLVTGVPFGRLGGGGLGSGGSLGSGGLGGGRLLRVVSAGGGYQSQDRQDGQKPGEARFPKGLHGFCSLG